jgi:glutathione peroxidase
MKILARFGMQWLITLGLCSVFGFGLGLSPADAAVKPSPLKTLLDFEVKSNDGVLVKLAQYRGKVLLVVNTASKCGYTSQYKGLQTLHDRYRSKGLEILAFPSNDFGGQEPGSNAEIKKFCELNYKVRFPLFEKGAVSGKDKQPLFAWLISQDSAQPNQEIDWNFEKFLVGRDGRLISRFRSQTSPESPELIRAVEAALKAKLK